MKAEDTRKRRERMAARLAEETGITLPQAAELIDLLGENWTSLLREARAINWATAEPRDL